MERIQYLVNHLTDDACDLFIERIIYIGISYSKTPPFARIVDYNQTCLEITFVNMFACFFGKCLCVCVYVSQNCIHPKYIICAFALIFSIIF